VPARLINIKYITIRAEKVASPVTALHQRGIDNAPTFPLSPPKGWLKNSASQVWELKLLVRLAVSLR